MMFDEQQYREVLSQVRASDGLTRRIMTMKQEQKANCGRRSFGRIALATALIALMVISVCASESVQNWFISFFADINRGRLTQEQVAYIEENAHPILESQTHNGWTVEMHSAIRDDTTVYIIFHIQGPENVDLSQWTDEEGNLHGQLMFGNSLIPLNKDYYFDYGENLWSGAWGEMWQDDGDGLPYTTNMVFHLEPEVTKDDMEAFGAETVYHFRFEDIIWFWADLEYQQELEERMKAEGRSQLTDEEIKRSHLVETLGEGTWEFEISFSQLQYVPGETLEMP